MYVGSRILNGEEDWETKTDTRTKTKKGDGKLW